MAIKLPKFLGKFVQIEQNESDKKEIRNLVKKELDKANFNDVIRFNWQQLPYQDKNIRKNFPLGVSFNVLRDFSNFYPIARACIEWRKAQVTQLSWNVTPVELTAETVKSDKNVNRARELKKFFKYPTGKKGMTFSSWLKQILEDVLVIDAVAIYKIRNRRGDIIGYLPIDAATIQLILLDDGTVPDPPAYAYMQKVGVREFAKLTTNDLVYDMMNPRTYNPFGRSPIETLIITITTALKTQAYQLGMLTEGNVPEGFVSVPRDIASSRDQLKEWQDAWDSMLAGDPRFQRKLKFLPEGMKYDPTIKSADMTFERFEKWLLLNTTACFGVPPGAIGFNFDTNRSSGTLTFESSKSLTTYTTRQFIKELIDPMIQDDKGYDDLEFTWTNYLSDMTLEEIKVADTAVRGGLMAIDEWRLPRGLTPTGAKDPLMMTPVGPVFVKDIAAQSDSGQLPVLPYKPPADAAASSPNTGNALAVPNAPNAPKDNKPEEVKISENDNDVVEELKKWRKTAMNDFKQGKKFRDFKTDVLDLRTQLLIKKGLEKATDRIGIEKVFFSFIGVQNELSNLQLYDEINNLIANRENQNTINS